MRLLALPLAPRRILSVAATAAVLCSCSSTKQKGDTQKSVAKPASATGGSLTLGEAAAPSGVSQIQILVMNANGCQNPVSTPAQTPISVATTPMTGPTGGKVVDLSGGKVADPTGGKVADPSGGKASASLCDLSGFIQNGTQVGGWFKPGMLGQMGGVFEQVMGQIFASGGSGLGGAIGSLGGLGGSSGSGLGGTIGSNNSGGKEMATAPSEPLPPTASSSNSCVVANVLQPYTAGQNLNLGNIPAGNYNLTVLWEDAQGLPIQHGSGPLSIVAGQTATAQLTMTPVAASAAP